MCVASNRQDRQHLRVVASLMFVLAGLAGIAQAAEFDEKVNAPMAKDAAALKSQAQSFVTQFVEMPSAGTEPRIAEPALARVRFDLEWQFQRSIDQHRPLGDVSALGLVEAGDGSYRIDLSANPQWRRLEEDLAAMLPLANLDAYAQNLIARGFLESDVPKLKTYVATHDVRAMAMARTLPMVLSFSRVVKKYDKAKRSIPDSLVLSYLYQRKKVVFDAQREWAVGLLEPLEPRSARVLLSLTEETQASVVWGPSDQPAGIADVLAAARLPDFEERAKAQAQGATP